MGLASSQARLLLLTARKSDLEFRAQQITNSEMILAMQTESVAREYSLKLSNQTLKYINASDSSEVEISALSLNSITSKNGAGMKLQVFVGITDENPDGFEDWKSDGHDETTYIDENGNIITADQYKNLPEEQKNNCKVNTVHVGSTNNYSGREILAGIQNGTMRIISESGEEVDAINGTNFSVAYDTSDDAQADAEYRRKTASIQIKEKRLQMDLSQVETQQKACETEIDSVKKIMDKNIERTFKVFS